MERFDLTKLVKPPEGVNINFSNDGKVVLNFANETTTSSTGISNVQKTIILQDILKAAQEKSYFLDAVYQSDAGIRENAKTVKLPIATSNLSFTEFTTEATDRTWTEITNLSTQSFNYSLKKYGAIVSKDVVKTSGVDVVKFAKDQMSYHVSSAIDTAIATALSGASSPAATLYGGDATSTATLASGDVLTPQLVAKGIRYLKANGWRSERDAPFMLFIGAEQEQALIEDPQFTNAAEYGSNEVVLNGEIGRYLGAKVIVSSRTPSATNWGSGSLNGHTCLLVKSKVCGGLVWFERPTLQAEYDMNKAATKIYMDVAYSAATLQEGAIVHIKVSDD